MTFTYVNTPDGFDGPHPSRDAALKRQMSLLLDREPSFEESMQYHPLAEWIVTEDDSEKTYWKNPVSGVLLVLEEGKNKVHVSAWNDENDLRIEGTQEKFTTLSRAIAHLFSLAMHHDDLAEIVDE